MTSFDDDPGGDTTSISPDAYGNPQSITFPATGNSGTGQSSIVYAYAFPGGPETGSTTYDESGNVVSSTAIQYGQTGEVLGEQSGNGPLVQFQYDPCYRLTAITNGLGNTTNYVYGNSAGYLSEITNTGGSALTQQFTEYDGNGNVLKSLDGNGVETDYVYNNPDGLLTNINLPSDSSLDTAVQYDSFDRPHIVTDSAGTLTYCQAAFRIDPLSGVRLTHP